MRIKNLSLALPLFLLFSCEPPEDIMPPVITLTDHASPATYTTGTEIHFEANFKDDNKLSQYKVVIAPDFEKSTVSSFYGPFTYESLVKLEDVEKKVHLHIDIPSNAAAGKYTMTITAKDADGNQAEPVTKALTFVNNADTGNPAVSIATPQAGSQVLPGGTVTLAGTLSDNEGLMDAKIRLVHQPHQSHIIYSKNISYDPETDISKDIFEEITISSTTEAGMYILQIITRDAVYNTTVKEVTIEVL